MLLAATLSIAVPLGLAAPQAQPAEPTEPTTHDWTTWPQWRGVTRTGVVEGTPWPATLTSENFNASWSVADQGDSYATPIVTRDRVFTVASVDGEEVAQAFDRATGERVWETSWAGKMKVPFFAAKNGSWIRSTPAFDGETLFVGGMRDVLVALDADDGSVRWRVDFVERYGTDLPSFGLVCSPLVDGDALYLQAGQSIVRLDRATGETVWRSDAAGGGGRGGMDSAFSSPIVATIAGQRQLVVQSRSHLAGVDPATGEELWSTPVRAFRGMNILTPEVRGDSIFTSAYGGRSQLFSVAKHDDGMTVSEAWSAKAEGYMTSPVVVDDHAYLYLRRKSFACVNLESGAVAWSSDKIGDEYWSLASQGNRILALADTGVLRLIEADPAEYRVAGEIDAVEGPSWAHISVVSPLEGDGADVFIRAQNSLHAFRWSPAAKQ